MISKSLQAIDFFCGTGGITYGFSLAGIQTIAGIDVDGECKKTYELNNPGSKFIENDIKKLTVNRLSQLVDIKPGDDSMVFVACAPCQYWTHINTDRKKSADSKYLLMEFLRFIDHYMPGYIVVENVKGVYNTTKKSKLPTFLKFLKGKKYAVDYGIINALNYGIPQNRKRFLLVASRVDKEITLPRPDRRNVLTVRDVIGESNGFKKIDAGHVDDSDFLHTTARLSEKNLRRLMKTPANGGTRLAWKDDPELQIPAYQDKDVTFKDTYGRMFWDRPAPTITTKFHSISNGRFAHPEENRGISLREGATLQTFPKTYIFRGSGILSIARQIGNAVPPELAKRIGQTLVECHCDIPNYKKEVIVITG